MNFISLEFIALIFISTIIYYIVPIKKRYLVICLANAFFYVYSCKFRSLYLLASMVSIFFAGLFINKIIIKKNEVKELKIDKEEKKLLKKKYNKQKKLILLLAIIINLGILLVLKYDNFFISMINSLFSSKISFHTFIVPFALSYYTLSALSYIIDVYNEKYEATNNFFKIFLFLSFYPLMVEGPICRFNEIGEQLFEGHQFDYQKYCNNLLRITWGFMKKIVIADRVGVCVDAIFSYGYSGPLILLGVFGYVIQIYAEFSGCMDIVIGIGGLFGIKLPENFNTPFFSRSVDEFWRRWHITLGTWLKDYIFYPVSISKLNMKVSMLAHKIKWRHLADTIAMILPLFCVWFIMGFWHGPTNKYIIYGMYYFVLMLLSYLLKPLIKKINELLHTNTEVFSYHLLQSFITLILATLGMALFRVADLNGVKLLIYMFQLPMNSNISILFNGYANLMIVILGTITLFIIDLMKYHGINIMDKLNEQNLVFKYIVYLTVIMVVLIFGMYGTGYDASSFIYGGF